MHAYRIAAHRYCLIDGYQRSDKGECYRLRDEINGWGGHFNRDKKRWECSYECAIALGAEFMYKVKIDGYCHINTESIKEATEKEIAKGYVDGNLCLCDGRGKAKILEVIGEATR